MYYRKHIDDLQSEHDDAKEFGDAAAEEWIKGLPLNGKQQMSDAARWERWEALHPPGTHPAKILRDHFRPPVSTLPASVSEQSSIAAASATPAAVPTTVSGHPLTTLPSKPSKSTHPSVYISPTSLASLILFL